MKRARQAMRLVFGPYQIFHIFSYTESERLAERIDIDQGSVFCTVLDTGYRFSIRRGENETDEVCKCSFWTSETSNRIRKFISLKAREAELVFLETNPAHRGGGLAKQLVEHASAKMLEQGFESLHARIWHSNTASLRTFVSVGWKYSYTIAEFYPFKRPLRLHLKLPKRIVY